MEEGNEEVVNVEKGSAARMRVGVGVEPEDRMQYVQVYGWLLTLAQILHHCLISF